MKYYYYYYYFTAINVHACYTNAISAISTMITCAIVASIPILLLLLLILLQMPLPFPISMLMLLLKIFSD